MNFHAQELQLREAQVSDTRDNYHSLLRNNTVGFLYNIPSFEEGDANSELPTVNIPHLHILRPFILVLGWPVKRVAFPHSDPLSLWCKQCTRHKSYSLQQSEKLT